MADGPAPLGLVSARRRKSPITGPRPVGIMGFVGPPIAGGMTATERSTLPPGAPRVVNGRSLHSHVRGTPLAVWASCFLDVGVDVPLLKPLSPRRLESRQPASLGETMDRFPVTPEGSGNVAHRHRGLFLSLLPYHLHYSSNSFWRGGERDPGFALRGVLRGEVQIP